MGHNCHSHCPGGHSTSQRALMTTGDLSSGRGGTGGAQWVQGQPHTEFQHGPRRCPKASRAALGAEPRVALRCAGASVFSGRWLGAGTSEQSRVYLVAGISLAGPRLFCMLSGAGSVPSFQEPTGTVAYSLLGVHWRLALTADPASTSPHPLTYVMLGVNLVPDIPKET